MNRGAVVLVALIVACATEPNPAGPKLQAMSFAKSEWSEPVNLGPVVNSAAGEQNAMLSPDELSLYFSSNRAGSLDIWVARRACTAADDPAPAPLGFCRPVCPWPRSAAFRP